MARAQWFGRPMSVVLAELGMDRRQLSGTDVPEDERSLWNARLFVMGINRLWPGPAPRG